MNLIFIVLILVCVNFVKGEEECCDGKEEVSTWQGSWRMYPAVASWSLQTRIPMTSEFGEGRKSDKGDTRGKHHHKHKIKKKIKHFIIPLLLAYKLKFFALVPVLIAGLVLLTKMTGLAGFFFALFVAVMGLKSDKIGH